MGEGNIILSLSILTGGGVQVSNIFHGRSIFQGPDVLMPIPMEPYTTCNFPVVPGLPAPSGSVFAPSLDRVWIFFLLLLLFLRPSQQYFSYVGTGLPVLKQYLARINVSYSRTQHNDANEARTRVPSVSSQALYH